MMVFVFIFRELDILFELSRIDRQAHGLLPCYRMRSEWSIGRYYTVRSSIVQRLVSLH